MPRSAMHVRVRAAHRHTSKYCKLPGLVKPSEIEGHRSSGLALEQVHIHTCVYVYNTMPCKASSMKEASDTHRPSLPSGTDSYKGNNEALLSGYKGRSLQSTTAGHMRKSCMYYVLDVSLDALQP